MDIGIDLGTTFSVIAVNGKVELVPGYPPGIFLEDCGVTIIPTPEGEQTFASVMVEDPDQPGALLFGSEAVKKAQEGFAPVMFSKRRIGTKEQIPMQSRNIVAKDFAREFLRHLKRCAEQALGCSVTRAVVTHPAYFDRSAVEETREAAQEAGFEMSQTEQMLMEPVAAALTYTRTDKRDPLRILTYDLGGGTFDVTYLERTGGVIDMRSFDGDHLLGGYNFDRELVHWLRQRLEMQGREIHFDEDDAEDRGRLARLLQIAEGVKIALANARSDSAFVDFRVRDFLIDVDGKPVQVNERLSREQFVQIISPYLDRTIECCQRALQKAGVAMDAVDEVLLAGGSSYGPWIRSSLATAFPKAEPKLFHPDLCVGAGAAIHAKLVLPPLVHGGSYRLVLDTPEKTVLSMANVTGRLGNVAGQPLTDALSAKLRMPDGSLTGPVPLSKDGRFLFADLELQDEASNAFTLIFQNSGGTTVFEHPFTIIHAPDATETSTVTTVLPKPLSILTFDGLVPLAEEGTTLPAKRSQTFQRDNDNPSITLQLFQEHDPIGEVRIENIPREGGRGSFVDLEVEVTEKNQVRGQATVRTRENRIVAKTPVSVRFHVPEVPSENELRAKWGDCEDRLAVLDDGEDSAIGAVDRGEANALAQRIERLFEQQPIERQEIHFALQQLCRLLQPPADDMKPTRPEFCQMVEQCRASIRDMAEKAQETLLQSRQGVALGQNFVVAAQKTLQRTEHFLQAVEKLEDEGMAAHKRRDQKSWARIHDAILGIEMQVHERPKMEAMPTFLLKLMAALEVRRAMEQLSDKAAAILSTKREKDWRNEIDRLEQGLGAVLEEIQRIEDELPPEQGRAQVQRIFARSLAPVREAIERLGHDVSKIAK